MSIWALSDGRPGHVNQTRALAAALDQLADEDQDLKWLEIRLRVGGFRLVLRWLLNYFRGVPPLWLVRVFYRCPPLPAEPPNCIISTGGKTLYLNAWLAEHFHCPNLFSGSLRQVSPERFTVFMTLVPMPAAGNNLVLDHAPTLIDPTEVSRVGARLRSDLMLGETLLWALLIGGERSGYSYSQIDWQQLVEAMTSLSKRYGGRWLLSTSRRTGRQAEEQLQALLSEEILADAVWWNQHPRPCLQQYIGAADAVLVTEDSMAMIADAIASLKPVCTLYPKRPDPEKSYRDALERLAANGRITRLAFSRLESDFVPDPGKRTAADESRQDLAGLLYPFLQRSDL